MPGVTLPLVSGRDRNTNVRPGVFSELTVPPEATTVTTPPEPTPTTARISVGEITVKLAAVTPPKLTELTPVKFVPVMVTVLPAKALAGVKPVIVGAEI